MADAKNPLTETLSAPNPSLAESRTAPLPLDESPERLGTAPTLDSSWLKLSLGSIAPPVPLVPPTLPGYQVLKEQGRGGMGVVYQARDLHLNRLVALKVLLSGSFAKPEDLIRFQVESEIAARVQHPNIVQVYEAGTWEGRPYLAMEWLEGGTLKERLPPPPPPREAARLMVTLSRAVHAAHCQGIIHRDLKPDNVLFTTPPASAAAPLANAILKITDFGLAKLVHVEEGLTETGTVLGTPYYMAPEQAAGKSAALGPAVDVYALGAMLYELLTSKPPFAGTAPLEYLTLVRDTEPPVPRKLRPALPADLETICLKCLAKKPEGRYPTAGELADDLERFLHDEPIHARASGALEKTWKWTRRNPLAAGLAAALVLVLVGSFFALGLLYDEARRQRRAAEEQRNVALAAEAEAQRASERAAAVNRFLVQDVLAQGLPEKAQDRQITFEAVILRSASRLDAALKADPAVEAEGRTVIGRMLASLARPDEALPHLERAHRLRLEHFGEKDASTLAAQTTLEQVRKTLEGRAQAGPQEVARLREKVELRTRELGPDHFETLNVSSQLAGALAAQGHKDEAQKLYRDLFARSDRALGANHPLTLGLENNLGFFLFRQGELAEAEALLQAAFAGMKGHLGESHPTTITCGGNNLALVLQARGKAKAAHDLFQQTYDQRKKVLGDLHPETLTALHNLAGSHYKQQQWAESEQLHQQALSTRRQVLGADHADTQATLYNFAQHYFMQRKHEEAIPLLREAVAWRRKNLGLAHPDTQHALRNLANELANTRAFAEAAELLRLNCEYLEKQLGPESVETLEALFNCAYCQARQANHKEAVDLYRRCWQGRHKSLGAHHPDTLKTLNELAFSEGNAGQWAEAEKHLRACWEGRSASLGPGHPQTLLAGMNLAAALANRDQFDAALKLLDELRQQLEQEKEPPEDLRERLDQLRRQALGRKARQATVPLVTPSRSP